MNRFNKNSISNESGCYKDCTSCSLPLKCCSHFGKINLPTLSKEEVEIIKKYSGNDGFYNKRTENIFHLKTVDDECVFCQKNKCSIYNYRPIDCRLYPYDIMKKEGKYYLIIYLVDCLNVNEFLKNNPCDNELIENVIPWIEYFTDEINYTKMKKLKYKIIKEVNIL